LVVSKRIGVTLEDKRVVIEFTFADPYEAIVFYEHIVDCLDKEIGFSLRIDGKNPAPSI
jgi:hypothetical protein